MAFPFKIIRRNKRIFFVCLVFALIAIFVLLRVITYDLRKDYKDKPSEKVQSTIAPTPVASSASVLGQIQSQRISSTSGLVSPTPSPKTETQTQTESQPQSSNLPDSASLDLPDFDKISYQPTNQTKEEFFSREKNLLGNIVSVQFKRIGTVQDKDKVTKRVIYTYQIKNEKIRVEIPGSIVISRSDGCFRQEIGSEVFHKYTKGQPEENCRKYTKWNSYSIEEFEAMSDFKILGEGNFEGKPATVVQAPISVGDTQFLMKGWFSNENGLTLFAGGVAADKRATVEFKDYAFGSFDDSLFDIPQDKVVESSELF